MCHTLMKLTSAAALALSCAVIASLPARVFANNADIADIVQSAQTEHRLLGLSAACMGTAGLVSATAGHADGARTIPLDGSHRFQIGSIAKTFTAAAVLDLVETGQLGLDDRLSRWYPGFPNAEGITLRHLLNMTAGTFDYFAATPENPVIPIVMQDVHRIWQADEMIGIVSELPAPGRPGEAYGYSNTNYLLIGRIVEAVTGADLASVFQRRLFLPAGLTATSLAGAPGPRGPMAHGVLRGSAFLFGRDDGVSIQPSDVDGLASLGWAAGGMSATSEDLARWGSALVEGRIVSQALVDEMRAASDLSIRAGSGYGLGIAHFDSEVGVAIGHAGAIPGYASILMVFPDSGHSVAVLTNDEGGEPFVQDIARDIADTACAG